MNRQDWETIQEIFNAAVELPRSERDAYIRAASQGNPHLYTEVDSLLKTDDLAEGFLEPILGPFSPTPSPIRPGDILSRRFRIQRLIGEGGMGHVFEAWDIELGRTVALKTIRPEIAQQPEALRRFRREVSLALILTHPHICRTFDIARDLLVLEQERGGPIELHFLTMEFLHGETLAARITRDGALPLDEALTLACQIGDALTCAHTSGIYHRDIKPANVMLASTNGGASANTRAVLTDFGLARQEALFRTDDFSAFSQSGIPIGTLPYMAPEQLEGKPATSATDIYAFGLVLFEMVTGKHVFPSGDAEINLADRLTTQPPSPRTLVPNLPEPWSKAIEGCLRPDPKTRYQSAAEVLTVLTGGHVSLPSFRSRQLPSKNGTPRRFAVSQWSRKLKLTAAIFSLLLVSLFVWGVRLYQQKGEAAVAPGALVYMTQIKNDTGEKSFDNLSELMQAGLTQSAHINLLDQGRVGDILQQMTKAPDTVITEPIAREIALRSNAARVVFASVTGHNGTYQLKVDLQQPDTSSPKRYRDHWQKTFAWQSTGTTNNGSNSGTIPAELLTTIRNTSDWIRKEAGESANDIAQRNAPPEGVTTSSWEALQNYDQALKLHANLKTREAIVLLQRAVGTDPSFALAYGRLGDLQFAIGANSDGLRSYSRALELSELQRLTLRERDRIRGLAATDSGDFESAEKAFRDYTVNYDRDFLGWFYLGYPLLMMGRTDEGLACTKHSYDLNPSSVSPSTQLGLFDAAAGNYQDAIESAKHLRESGFPGYSNYILGLTSFLSGQYDQATTYFTQLQNGSGPPGRTRGILMLARLSAEQGQSLRALELLNQGILEDSQAGRRTEQSAKLVDRASIEAHSGNYLAMIKDIDSALSLDESPARAGLVAMILGNSLRSSEPTMRTIIRERLIVLDHEYSGAELGNFSALAKHLIHAQVLLASGHWEDALTETRKAVTLDAPVSDHAYLAFFLLAAADHTLEVQRQKILREEAFAIYTQTVLHPGYAWKDIYRSYPGFLADEMSSYLDLASRLEIQNPNVANTRIRLRLMRPQLSTSTK